MTEHTHAESPILLKERGHIGCCAPREFRDDEGFYSRYREIVWSVLGGLFLLAGYVGEQYGLSRGLAVGLYLVTYALGGWDLTANLLRSVWQRRFVFNVDLLMLLAAIGAAILGNWAEGAFLLFLFALSHGLEHLASDRARHAIRALAKLTPDVATVLRDGRESELPIADVAMGDTVLVKPGERIPVDGTVSAGRSAVDQAPITGESLPVEKVAGSPVFAGTVNGDGVLEIANERAVGDRTLDRVVRLVEEAQTQKAPTERFADRFSAIFVPFVLVADLLLIVVPPLIGLLSWTDSFYRGMVMLVGACPCALALGTPSAVLAGIAQAARHGVLVKGGAHLENLGNVRAIAFDKTGTLTLGTPRVTDVLPLDGTEEELLGVAAAVERRSSHPLAEAVVWRAEMSLPLGGGQGGGHEVIEIQDLQNVPGMGLRGTLDGETVEVGNPRMFGSPPPTVLNAVAQLVGRSVIVVRRGERWLGVIGVADEARASARTTLEALRALGVKPLVMLTGDARDVAEAIAQRVGIDETRSELLPEDKATVVRELMAAHRQVAMVGDGVNDAPALAHATVGIAMGGAGTAVALETADVALMGDDLARLPFAVALARRASRTIRANLFISLGVIALLIVTTATGFMRIGLAVVLHEGSTLVVLANSLRLLRFKGTP